MSGRLKSCGDLVAEEAVYHKTCYCCFMSGRHNPRKEISGESGRRVDGDKMALFDSLCNMLESSCELHSVSDLFRYA